VRKELSAVSYQLSDVGRASVPAFNLGPARCERRRGTSRWVPEDEVVDGKERRRGPKRSRASWIFQCRNFMGTSTKVTLSSPKHRRDACATKLMGLGAWGRGKGPLALCPLPHISFSPFPPADPAAAANFRLAGRGFLAFQGPLVFFPEVFLRNAVVDEVPGEEFVGAAFS